ncbi:hypothetical protein [Reichenbachiella ulvae]|uniref:Internalin A n=1 Tax=Reichenbachiella ulvae TaxID=2980104 RepID=A0ABT3CZD7_9BACT|nr:hypothetical protein [Reichenbachiella ulvae]MCV9388573.1 hypothetical protein [Reichenbachiella ulvae]
MTEKQIKHGVWHVTKGFVSPSKSITLLKDYRPVEKLNLLITQTHLKPYDQRKNYENWCKRLPELEEVKFIWLPSKVNQKIFEAVCKMPNLEGLWIKWSSIKHIDNLIHLGKLKHLHLGSSSQVENIDVLGSLHNLESLETEQLNKISDFSVLSNLSQLQGLGIDGSIWTAQKIDTLEPIRNLTNLKYLSTTNSQIKDKSFNPLLELNQLVTFNCSWNYPESEFAKLKSLPNLKYGNIETSWKELKGKLLGKLL